ncbi:MAG: gliding motility-associated C-terminal domain-containing protein [Bacteroidota bacterium]
MPVIKSLLKIFLGLLALIGVSYQLSAQTCTINAGTRTWTICEGSPFAFDGQNPTGTTPAGTITWSQIGGPSVVISDVNSPTSSVLGMTGGNTYRFLLSADCTTETQEVTVTIEPITEANAGLDVDFCPDNAGNITVNGNTPQNPSETGRWAIVSSSNNAGITINFPNSPTTTISMPPTSCGDTRIAWIIEGPEYAPGQNCESRSEIVITNFGGVDPVDAGFDQNLGNCYSTTQSTELDATFGGCDPATQIGTWSFVSGPSNPVFTDVNNADTRVSNLIQGTYELRWTVQGPCSEASDTMTINVPAPTQDVSGGVSGPRVNLFICDNGINSITIQGEVPQFAGETVNWTQTGGTALPPGSIVTPNSSSTIINNLVSPGNPYTFVYTVTNTNTGCGVSREYRVDFRGSSRTVEANGGDDFYGNCGQTNFEIPVVSTGTGSTLYRILSGPADSPLAPFPTSYTNPTGLLDIELEEDGTYVLEFIRSEGGELPVGCTDGYDTMNVFVSGVSGAPNAGTDFSIICGQTTTTVVGNVPPDGTPLWTQISGPQIATIVTPYSSTTDITGLVPGEYVFQYEYLGGSSCPSIADQVTISSSSSSLGSATAGPDQSACVGAQVLLAANTPGAGEFGTWSQVSGPDTITFSDSNDPNATATGFNSPSATYELQWTIDYINPGPSGCSSASSSTLNINTGTDNAPGLANAGNDQCIALPLSSINLAADPVGPGETGTWSVAPAAGVTINTPNDPNSSVTLTNAGAYVFTWTVTNGVAGCTSASDDVEVVLADTANANAGPDQNGLCSNTVNLAATISNGATGEWSYVSGPGGFSFSDITDPNATVTIGFSGTYVFEWTVTAGSCSTDSDQVSIEVGVPPTTANAGPDQDICNSTNAVLGGNPYTVGSEIGVWSVLSGAPSTPVFSNSSQFNTTVSGLETGIYTFRWTISSINTDNCPQTSDDVTIEVYAGADAGSDQDLCDVTSFLLEGTPNSTGTWSLVSGPSSPAPTINQPTPNSPLASVDVSTSGPGTYEFQYQTNSYNFVSGGTCPGSTDNVIVEVSQRPSFDPTAGPDQDLCTASSTSLTLAGNAPPADGTTAEWVITFEPVGSTATISDPTNPTASLDNLTTEGIYVLEWRFANGNCVVLADVVRFEVYDPPTPIEAGDDNPQACIANYLTNATTPTSGIGTWSITSAPSGSATTIDSPNNPVTGLSNISLGTYVLTWEVTNGPFTSPSPCAPQSDTVTITFNDVAPSQADAGPDQLLCNENQTRMAAQTPTSGNGTWTQTAGAATTIASPNNPQSVIIGLSPGIYEYTWTTTTSNNDGCIFSDAVTIEVTPELDTANAGPDASYAQFSPVAMAATAPTTGIGTWSQISGPTTAGYINVNDPNTQLTGLDIGIYEFEWTVSNGTCDDEDDRVIITIVGNADLELTKTVSASEVNTGDTVSFTISIFNNDATSSVDATGVAVRDVVPDGYSVVLGSVSNDGVYNPGNFTIDWSNLTVPSGTTLALTFDAVINATGDYDNSAEITASDQNDPDSDPNNDIPTEDDQDNAIVTVRTADLSLTKTVTPSSVSVGDLVTFSLEVTNAGANDATGVTLQDVVPDGYTIGTVNNGGSLAGSTITWAGLSLSNGSSTTVTFTATVNPPTGATNEYQNTAQITASDQNDPDSQPNNDDGDQSEDDEDSAQITLEQVDLELNISNNTANGNVGDTVDYTVSLFNNDAVQTGDASGAEVTVTLPPGLDIVPGSITNGGVYNAGSGTITWSNLDVANGDTLDLDYQVTVNGNGNYNTTGQLTASDLVDVDSAPNNDDGDQSEDDEDSAPFALQTADLSLTKTVTPSSVSVGDLVTFSLEVANAGANDATGVTLQDIVPDGYTIGTVNNGGSLTGSTITWAGLSVSNGSSTTVTFTATVNPPTGATNEYQNTAQITASDQNDPNSQPNNDDGDQSEDDEDSAQITLEQVDLELNISNNTANGNVGDTVDYTVSLFNNPAEVGDASGAEVTVTLPPGLDIVPGSITNGGVYNAGSGTITWSNLDVANGDTLDLDYQVTVNGNGNYNTTGQLTASDLVDVDSAPNNDDGDQSEDDEDSAPFALQEADLRLEKTISGTSTGTPNIGETVTFELTVTNDGPNTATNVVLEDELPAGLTLLAINNGGTAIANTFLRWEIPTLPVGSTTVSYEVEVNAPRGFIDEYLNIAEITASDQNDPDSEPFNNDGDQSEDDEDFFVIDPQLIDIAIDLSVNDPNPNVGEVVTFTLDVSNLGDDPATGVDLQNLIPPGYGAITNISNGGIFSGGAIDWSGLSITNGNTLTLTFDAEVLAPTGASGEYQQVAQVTAADQFDVDSTPNNDDGDQSEDEEDNAALIPQQADLSLQKTVSDLTPNIGDSVTFTLTITNQGPDPATGVAVEDFLPTGYTLTGVNQGGTPTGNSASWSGLSVLANGGSIALTYTATVNAPTGAVGEYVNTAQITASDQHDPDSDPTTDQTVDEDGNGNGDDDDEDTLTLSPNIGDLELTKIVIDNDITPPVGSEISFEITVFNVGGVDANSVVVRDLLPSGYDFVLYSSTSGIYNENTGIWQVGNISAGGNETLVIDVLVNETGTYTNGAEIISASIFDTDSTPNNDILAEDDQDEAVVTPQIIVDLSLTKTVDNATPLVTDNVVFTLTLSNDGPSTATNIQVSDALPSGFNYISHGGGGTYVPGTGLWSIPNLGIGNSAVLNITASINTSGDYINGAEVIAHDQTDIDSTPGNDLLTEDDQDEVLVTPRQLVDISVNKIADTNTPNIGSNITFTITVTNDGPSDATAVVVTDLLASGYAFVSATPSVGTYADDNGSWTVGTLPNSTSQTLVIEASVLANGIYANTAELTDVNEEDIDSFPANNDDTEDDQSTVVPTPVLVSDLALTKAVNNTTPLVGEVIEFTLNVTNNGPSTATGITVLDLLPTGYTYVSNTATAGNYNETTGVWSLNGQLPNGTTETLEIMVTVNPSGDYANTAEIITADNVDSDSVPGNGVVTEDDQDEALTTPIPLADLSLVKTVDNEFPDVSDQITFTLTLSNAGPSEATGIQVADLLPSGYQYISDNSGGNYDPNTGLWNIASLAADTDLRLNIVVGINTTGSYLNTAEIIAVNEQDPNSVPNNDLLAEDDQDEQLTLPRVITDISLTKTVDNPSPSVGSNIIFTISVTNAGPSDATGLVIEDILASGYQFVGATPSNGLYDEVIGSWSLNSLPNGATETLTIEATVLSNGEYANIAELIAMDTFDPDSSPDNNLNSEDDQDTVTPVPTGLADLSITKAVDDPAPNVGDIIEFTINLTNSGDSQATGVQVSELLPVGLGYEAHTATAGTYNETDGVWNLNGPILVGTTETLIVLVQVNAPTGAEGEYTNNALIINSNQADPDSDPRGNQNVDDLLDGIPDDDEAQIIIEPQSIDLAVEKTVNNAAPSIGEQIAFTITVSNLSALPATNIGIEERLPNGYSLVTVDATSGNYDVAEGFWEINTLNGGDVATLVLTVEVLEQNDYANTASLAFVDQFDTDPSNDAATMTIEPNCLVFYNEFSPNGDGVNETFVIDCISQYPNSVLKIYNRWGNVVYEKEGYNNEFNGISNGRVVIYQDKFLPVGTYYYILELGDGSKPITNWLYLNR